MYGTRSDLKVSHHMSIARAATDWNYMHAFSSGNKSFVTAVVTCHAQLHCPVLCPYRTSNSQ